MYVSIYMYTYVHSYIYMHICKYIHVYISGIPECRKLLYTHNSTLVRKVGKTQKFSFTDELLCRLSMGWLR